MATTNFEIYLLRSYVPFKSNMKKGTVYKLKKYVVPLTGDPNTKDLLNQPLYNTQRQLAGNKIVITRPQYKLFSSDKSMSDLLCQVTFDGTSTTVKFIGKDYNFEDVYKTDVTNKWKQIGMEKPPEATAAFSWLDKATNLSVRLNLVLDQGDDRNVYVPIACAGLFNNHDHSRVANMLKFLWTGSAAERTYLVRLLMTELELHIVFFRHIHSTNSQYSAIRIRVLEQFNWLFRVVLQNLSLKIAEKTEGWQKPEKNALTLLQKIAPKLAKGEIDEQSYPTSYEQLALEHLIPFIEKVVKSWKRDDIPNEFIEQELLKPDLTQLDMKTVPISKMKKIGLFFSVDIDQLDLLKTLLRHSVLTRRNPLNISYRLGRSKKPVDNKSTTYEFPQAKFTLCGEKLEMTSLGPVVRMKDIKIKDKQNFSDVSYRHDGLVLQSRSSGIESYWLNAKTGNHTLIFKSTQYYYYSYAEACDYRFDLCTHFEQNLHQLEIYDVIKGYDSKISGRTERIDAILRSLVPTLPANHLNNNNPTFISSTICSPTSILLEFEFNDYSMSNNWNFLLSLNLTRNKDSIQVTHGKHHNMSISTRTPAKDQRATSSRLKYIHSGKKSTNLTVYCISMSIGLDYRIITYRNDKFNVLKDWTGFPVKYKTFLNNTYQTFDKHQLQIDYASDTVFLMEKSDKRLNPNEIRVLAFKIFLK